jgi:hypothetical protein
MEFTIWFTILTRLNLIEFKRLKSLQLEDLWLHFICGTGGLWITQESRKKQPVSCFCQTCCNVKPLGKKKALEQGRTKSLLFGKSLGFVGSVSFYPHPNPLIQHLIRPCFNLRNTTKFPTRLDNKPLWWITFLQLKKCLD